MKSLEEIFERADARAAEREERTRRMELEMEAKMREREDGERSACLQCLVQQCNKWLGLSKDLGTTFPSSLFSLKLGTSISTNTS